jgi:DNA-directed RNA polymerase subunit M/transcription elongation factor TFIIS
LTESEEILKEAPEPPSSKPSQINQDNFSHIMNDGSNYQNEFDQFYQNLDMKSRNNCYNHLKKIFKPSTEIIFRIFRDKLALKQKAFSDQIGFNFDDIFLRIHRDHFLISDQNYSLHVFCHLVEATIFEYIQKNPSQNYEQFCRTKLMILKHPKANNLRLALILQDYPLNDLFEKEDIEILSTKEELETRIKEAEWNLISKQIDFYKMNANVEEGEFTCGKCRNKRILSFQKQMRSADEPMTTFFQCQKCNHNWKMG